MSTQYTDIRGQAMGIRSTSTQPTLANTADGTLPAGEMYTDPLTGKLWIYGSDGVWRYAVGGTTTSTSTTSSSSSSTSTTSSSTSSTSSSTSSTSSSSSSSSTSTTLF